MLAMTMRTKETSHGTTQTACCSRSAPRPASGRSGCEDGVRQGRLAGELKKARAERALNAEIAHNLAADAADGRANSRNGYGRKSVLTETGKIALGVPGIGCRPLIRS